MLTVAWDGNINDAGYKLYYGQKSGVYTQVIDVGKVTEYSVDVDLSNPVYFAATAYDNNGFESDKSEELEVGTTSPRVAGKSNHFTLIKIENGIATSNRIITLPTLIGTD